MAESPAAPAPPEIEVERGIRLDELPVAQIELEPPYRVLIHNDDVTNAIQGCGLFQVAATAGAEPGRCIG